MGTKMNKAPVFFTVAQIRLNPVSGLDASMAAIYDKMKGIGFPEHSIQMAPRFVPPGKDANPPVPSMQFFHRYLFDNSTRTAGFVIEHDAMSFLTTDYQTFELFLETFQSGISIVNDAVHFGPVTRIGLRYLDAVQPPPDESLSQYLIPEVLGLSNRYPGTLLKHAFSETVADIPAGRIVSRVAIKEGALGLPPDMAQLEHKIADRFLRSSGRHAILDTDAYSEPQEQFDPDKTGAIFKALHDEIVSVFTNLATPHAVAAWKREV